MFRILAVENDKDINRTVCMFLNSSGYQATGCGIKPEAGQHIFDKILSEGYLSCTQGNGLGLTLMKQVEDILNGEIGMQRICGEGSTFTVRIRRG